MAKQHGYSDRDRESIQVITFNEDWIVSGIKEDAVIYAEQLGINLANERFTTSQIRNFYGELKRIQLNGIEKHKSSFHLLHPKLAYAAKRAEKGINKGKGANIFKQEILQAHKSVRIDSEGFEKRFKNFCDLCEAILAFHKAHGGSDN
jgi:CRISPR-associated protein Csm2